MGTVHPDILSKQHLNKLLYELTKYYDKNQIFNLNLNNWYEFHNKKALLFSKSKSIFAIEIAIVYPNKFQYFHLFPIPTIQTLPGPRKQSVVCSSIWSNSTMYLKNLLICKQEEMKFIAGDDCIVFRIQNRDAHCQQTLVQIQN